jgi:hypothetical protein
MRGKAKNPVCAASVCSDCFGTRRALKTDEVFILLGTIWNESPNRDVRTSG